MEGESDPPDRAPGSVTHLLGQVRAGRSEAVDELASTVYRELQRIAHAIFAQQHGSHTLQATALVHEAWMKLAPNIEPIQDRHHFFVIAGRAMRQVIADHARKRRSEKRGGSHRQVSLGTDISGEGEAAVDLVDLDDSLRKLAEHDERHAAVAELRLFGGLSIAETARALDLSPRTVDSAWAMAKAWLRRDLTGPR